jgi:1-pyrroline-5-carboxylate dehydrogenase
MLEMLKEIKIGPPTEYENFINAVIEESAFDKIMHYIDFAKSSSEAEIIWGGKGDNRLVII